MGVAKWLWTSGDWEVEGIEVCPLEVDEEREESRGNGRPGTNVRKSIIHVTGIANSTNMHTMNRAAALDHGVF